MTASKAGARARPGYGRGREALLAAVIRVVAEGGLRNLTYRAVAREAGVAHGLVTHHFGSRDALLAAALRYSLERSIPALTADPGSGRIDSLFDGLAEMVEADPATQAFQFELILEARRQPELRPLVEALYDAYRAALRAELDLTGLDWDDDMVHLLFAALDGLVFQQTSMGDARATERSLAALRKVIRRVEAGS